MNYQYKKSEIYSSTPEGEFSPKLLVVDLSAGNVETVYMKEAMLRKFIGGAGLAAKITWDETTAETAPLSEDNPLMFMVGPLTAAVPYGGRHIVAGLSPLTNIRGEAHSGGHWGYRLRTTGYIGIVAKGKSEKPVYLYVSKDRVELKDAAHLWGKDTYEVDDILKTDLGEKVSVASIGQAGENLVKFAAVMHDGKRGRAAARCGMGALMGFKKLKAIAVQGSGSVEVRDKAGLSESVKKYFPKGKITDEVRQKKGRELWESIHQMGRTPIKNWGAGQFGSFDKDVVDILMEAARNDFCFGCRTSCVESRLLEDGSRHTVWEAIAPIGSQCLIDDYEALHEAYQRCNRYGMDSISFGATIAFAMECAENGIIKKKDMEGIDLKWGNAEAMLALTNKIAFQEGFLGKTLAEGTRRAAEIIGGGAEKFAMQVKGLEIAAHDPRAYNGAAIENATSTFGGSHMSGFTSVYYEYEVAEDLDGAELSRWVTEERLSPYQIEGQGKLTATAQDFTCLLNSLTLCLFTNSTDCYGRPPMQPPSYIDYLNHITGWDVEMDEFYAAGRRIFNLQRMISMRHGVRGEDDTLPERFLKEKRGAGPAAENIPQMDKMLEEYYSVRGWDPDGIPTAETLESFGLNETLTLHKELMNSK